MEYRQYHEDGANFEKIFHSQELVAFSQANLNGFFSLHELLRMTSDLAVEDYNQQGMSREFLKEKGYGILVSRCAFRFHKIPVENQRVEFVTWEEKPEPLQLARCYKILGENGDVLVSGKSYWMVVDINARRILPSAKFSLLTKSQAVTQMDCLKPGKIIQGADMELWDTRKIKFSDIDTNGHTTNSRYAAFIEDALPAEYRPKMPVDFRINFSKEAMLDSEIEIYGKIEDEGKKITVVGKTSEGLSFESELYF